MNDDEHRTCTGGHTQSRNFASVGNHPIFQPQETKLPPVEKSKVSLKAHLTYTFRLTFDDSVVPLELTEAEARDLYDQLSDYFRPTTKLDAVSVNDPARRRHSESCKCDGRGIVPNPNGGGAIPCDGVMRTTSN